MFNRKDYELLITRVMFKVPHFVECQFVFLFKRGLIQEGYDWQVWTPDFFGELGFKSCAIELASPGKWTCGTRNVEVSFQFENYVLQH